MIKAATLRNSRPVKPSTVYRTLEFLMSQGQATKIESRNTYVPCLHPERPHECLFYICVNCGASIELEDQRLEHLIAENTVLLGFSPTRRVVEVEGTCARCIATDTA